MKRLIVCTGPISSGTRLLTRVVTALCPDDEVKHRSMPHWDRFWSVGEEFPGRQPVFLIITRRADYSIKSAYREGHGNPEVAGWEHYQRRLTKRDLEEWWWKAMGYLSLLPNSFWLSYEAMVTGYTAQTKNIAHWLGVEWRWENLPDIYDGNEKWR